MEFGKLNYSYYNHVSQYVCLNNWLPSYLIIDRHPIKKSSEQKVKPNKYSSVITEDISHLGAQAFLHAIGLKEEDLEKPQVGVLSVGFDSNPCNNLLNKFGEYVRQSLEKENLLGFAASSVGVSDAITQGTSGMNYSLPSRDLIADSFQMIVEAQQYDASVLIPGCDKNMPGALMAALRYNRPSIIVYGGTIKPGTHQIDCQPLNVKKGDQSNITDTFEAYGAYLNGKISEPELKIIKQNACPGSGSCGGLFTANTMSSIIEAMVVRNLLEKDIKPRDIMTRSAFLNAITIVMILGGSTNSVLHLLAIARSGDVELTMQDFSDVAARTPFLANMKPSGKYMMQDLHEVGGLPAVLKYVYDSTDLLDGSCLTVTGQTLAENLANITVDYDKFHTVIHPLQAPIKDTGHIRILNGSLAPGNAVAKITGKEGLKFEGTAMCFEEEDDVLQAVADKRIVAGTAVILRYKGPKGAPGMPEMLTPTAALYGASHGFVIGHVVPEAFNGGPIALIKDGDRVIVDAIENTIDVDISQEELARRQAEWKPRPLKHQRGVLYKYSKLVSDASHVYFFLINYQMRNANDALNSLSARLKGEVDSITAQIEAGNEFEIYIKALSLLTDIEHLRKNIGLEFEGYDNFRGFVDSTGKKASSDLVYPTLPPTIDAVLDNKETLSEEPEFVPRELTDTVNEVSLEKPTTSQPVQPSEPVKKPQPSYTYDYHKEKELYESRRKGKDTNGAVSQRSARAEQDDLSEELIAMTKQLKQNALALSQGLSSDMPLIEQTSNKLEVAVQLPV
ncbi:dihydroxy-acid dehydratase [Wallemia mellicola]|nr:dihydroxy-acid dehydratase [Wallemia mellicola]